MFDFLLHIGNNPKMNNPFQEDIKGYDPLKHKINYFRHEHFTISGLSYISEKNDIAYDKRYYIAIIGKVFLKDEKKAQADEPLSALEILAHLINKHDFKNDIKGNYAIIIYDLKNGELKVINDHFAFRPLYYCLTDAGLIVSNNLNLFRRDSFKWNEPVVLEKFLFTYPLSNETYIKNVYFLQGGEILYYSEKGFSKKSYFDLKEFVFRNNSIQKFNIHRFIELFNGSVIQRAQSAEKQVVSLTGGYDGRTIVSALLKYKKPFKCYSFGKFGGENTKIPCEIAEKLNLDYLPVYLEEDFEKNYAKFAVEAIYFSDGGSINERANYPYTFNQISNFSQVVLSGLVGGELLARLHLCTDYINQLYYDTVYQNHILNVEKYLETKGYSEFIDSGFVQKNKEAVAIKVKQRNALINELKSHKNGFLYYYYDLLSQGYRMFYGNEAHLERYYADNLTPFLDYDILDYLLSTDYILNFRNSFRTGILNRRNNRLVQTKIIKTNFPALAAIKVDRGFPPVYSTNTMKRFLIPYLYYKRKRRLKKAPLEFRSDLWSRHFLEHVTNCQLEKSEIFDVSAIKEQLKKPYTYSNQFNSVLSFYIWEKF